MSQEDKAMKLIQEMYDKDRDKCIPISDDILKILSDKMKEDNELSIKHCCLALSKALGVVTQSFCKNEEEFNDEMKKAHSLATNTIFPSMMPLMKDGQVIEKDFDYNNLSVRRILMALAISVDYLFWRSSLTEYSDVRSEVEMSECTQQEQ